MAKAKKKRKKWFTQQIKVTEFVVGLCDLVDGSEVKVVFFVGAGCSISSGIPGAKKLVLKWLEFLKRKKTGNPDGLDEWAKGRIPGYDPEDPAAKYGEVFFEAYPDEKLRQLEIERICANAKPELGYILLAQLMSDKKYGPHFNAVLTTNFDDLIAEAFYLYSYDRPRMYVHESLYKYIDTDTIKPFVIKLHGDAHYDPKSTKLETVELNPKVRETIDHLLYKKALVFLGYGGNDNSIAKWFEDVKWVRHSDFDELLFHIAEEFDLSIPKKKVFLERYEKVERIYQEALGRFQKAAPEIVDAKEREALVEAVSKTAKQFQNWWAVQLEADKYEKTDTRKADEIYRDGLEQFPDSSELMGNYAVFLKNIREDCPAAEEYYKRAIKAGPNNPNALGNYAVFLKNVHEDYEAAEDYYKRAVEADPENAINSNNYGLFLYEIRKDYDGAEEYFKRAIKADPDYAKALGNYALILKNVREDFDAAEKYYKRAVEADPDNTVNLGNYANFLYGIREDYPAAEEYYKRAIKADPKDADYLGNYAGFLFARGRADEAKKYLEKALELADNDPLIVESYFYRYAHSDDKKERAAALSEVKKLITSGVRSPGWDLSQNVARAVEDGHPEPEFLALLAKVIADEAAASELDQFEAWKDA
jgi:Tfp pilus assembly protein PilF